MDVICRCFFRLPMPMPMRVTTMLPVTCFALCPHALLASCCGLATQQ